MFKLSYSLGLILISFILSNALYASDNINYNGYSFTSQDNLGPVVKKRDKRKIDNTTSTVQPVPQTTTGSTTSEETVKLDKKIEKPILSKKVSKKESKKDSTKSSKKSDPEYSSVSVVSIKAKPKYPSMPFDKDPMKVSAGYLNK